MSYDALRHAADSWGLIYLMIVFIGIVLWAFRPGPGARKAHDEAAQIPLKED